VDAERLYDLVFLFVFDSFRDHHRTLVIGKTNERGDEVLLDEVGVDSVDERYVELDEIRLQVRDGAETGVAAAASSTAKRKHLSRNARSRSRNLG